jgi:hypothetical protein
MGRDGIAILLFLPRRQAKFGKSEIDRRNVFAVARLAQRAPRSAGRANLTEGGHQTPVSHLRRAPTPNHSVKRFRESQRELCRLLTLSVGPTRHASRGSITDGTCPKWSAFLRIQGPRRSVGRHIRNSSCDAFSGSGRWRQRRSAGTGECQRSQRLNQGPKRYRQCRKDAVASAACDQAGDTHHRCAAQRDTAVAAPGFGSSGTMTPRRTRFASAHARRSTERAAVKENDRLLNHITSICKGC